MLSNCDIGGFRFMKTGFFKKAAAVFYGGRHGGQPGGLRR